MGRSTLELIKRCAEFQPRAKLSSTRLKVRGLYALLRYRPRLKQYDVVYVGLATKSVGSRLRAHSRSKRKGRLWTHFSVFEVRESVGERVIRELEGLFRHVYRKDSRANPLNRQRRFRELLKVRINDLRKWTPDGRKPKRHVYIAKKALLLDNLIEAYVRARRLRKFPRQRAREIAALLFPGSSYADDGAYKTGSGRGGPNDWKSPTDHSAPHTSRSSLSGCTASAICIAGRTGSDPRSSWCVCSGSHWRRRSVLIRADCGLIACSPLAWVVWLGQRTGGRRLFSQNPAIAKRPLPIRSPQTVGNCVLPDSSSLFSRILPKRL